MKRTGAKRSKISQPKRAAIPPKRSKPRQSRSAVKTLTKTQIARQFERQRTARALVRDRKKAEHARDTYKARKKDRGKLVMAGVSGQHSPERKGRKGFLLYVTKTGKKWLVRQKGQKGAYKPRKLNDFAPPIQRNLRKAVAGFQQAQKVMVGEGRAVVKATGTVQSGGTYDFSDKLVKRLAKVLKTGIEKQAAKRNFMFAVKVLTRLPDGSTRVFDVEVPIAKADHISIKIAGLENFVRQKFYAFMAKELAFHGYVTSGSANHIRRLKINEGLDRSEWTTADGQAWQGREDTEQVTIQSFEWQLQQVQ